jgi:hypothetical protein
MRTTGGNIKEFARTPHAREPLATATPCAAGRHLSDSLCVVIGSPFDLVTALQPGRRIVVVRALSSLPRLRKNFRRGSLSTPLNTVAN